MYKITTTKLRKVLVLIAIIFLVAFKHPFYLGVTDLKYNSKEKTLQGSVKLFTNDLEASLKKIHKGSVDLINTKNKEETKKMLFDYLKDRFELKANNKSCFMVMQFNYSGLV